MDANPRPQIIVSEGGSTHIQLILWFPKLVFQLNLNGSQNLVIQCFFLERECE